MKLSPEIQDSLELRFSNLARTMNEKGSRIISLGLGEPGFPTPPEIVEAAADAMRAGFTRYSNPFGLSDLRDAVCRKLRKDNDIEATPSEVMITPGAKMALSLVLGALLEPGDEVINILPCYPSYLPQIRIAEPDAVIHNIDLRQDNFRLDLDRIGACLSAKTKAIILNFPHNPTGRMLNPEELDGLVQLFADHPCRIISDEIYERLNFSGTCHLSPGAVPALAERTITINGFSKAYSMTGWRIGYLVAKGPIMSTISKLQQHLNTNVAPFIQYAARVALTLDSEFLNRYNEQLEANARCIEKAVNSSPNLQLIRPEGGLFAFLDIRRLTATSDDFCCRLLEQHAVAATPGLFFGPNWDGFVRISLAIDHESFTEGVCRLTKFVEHAS